MKYFYILIIVLASCKHNVYRTEEVPTPNTLTECVSFPILDVPTLGGGYKKILDSTVNHIDYACFNPNNPNEIYYEEMSTKRGKFNLKTNSATLIFRDPLRHRFAKWGKKDWILLNWDASGIWKIKSNGDSLQQVISIAGKQASSCEWNYKGDKFVFYTDDKVYYIVSENGILLDSFPLNFRAAVSWQNPKGWLLSPTFFQDGNVSVYDIPNSINIAEYSVGKGWHYGLSWLSNDVFVCCTSEGVYIVDIGAGGTVKKIRNACDRQTYYDPSYSEQTNKILFIREDAVLVNKTTLKLTQRVVIMNPDGTNEEVINIPR